MIVNRYQFPVAATSLREQTDFHYVLSQVKRNLMALQRHTQQFSRYLSRSHLLLRLLSVLPIDLRTSQREQENRLFETALESTRPLGLFSPIHKGEVLWDVFFNNRCPELIFCSMDGGRKPIRCLRHPFESLNFWSNEPTALEFSDQLAVFSLDLLALVNAYRDFVNQQPEAGAVAFFYQLLLPDLLNDIALTTWVNRFNTLLEDQPCFVDEPRRTPFFVDYNERLDRVMINILQQFLDCDGHPLSVRAILPMLWQETPRFPRIALNANTYGLCFLSEAHYLTLLLILSNRLGGRYLDAFKNSSLTELRNMQTGGLLVADDPRLSTFLQSELKRILGLLKTRR